MRDTLQNGIPKNQKEYVMRLTFSSIVSRASAVQTYNFAGVSFDNLPGKDASRCYAIKNGAILKITGISKDRYKTEQFSGAKICEACGSLTDAGQSCGCFDNNCQ
jgi:hypothetical protein